MESKCAGGKESGPSCSDIEKHEILAKAAEFFMGEEFQDAIDAFVEKNCHLFSNLSSDYSGDPHRKIVVEVDAEQIL